MVYFTIFGLQLHVVGLIVAGVASIFATLVSLYLIYKHLRNYTQPALQRPIIRILFMVPIFVTDSWLSLRFHEYALYFDLVRDSYEAYVIYQFFILLVSFINTSYVSTEIANNPELSLNINNTSETQRLLGDKDEENRLINEVIDASIEETEKQSETERENHVVILLESKDKYKHPLPLCCLPKYKPGQRFFDWSRRCILQFVVIKPLLAIFSASMEIAGYYGDGEILNPKRAYLYVTIIDNTSITISMYFLVLFYTVTKEELAPFKPVPKFLCIKAVIFFSFWQGVCIALLVRLDVLKGTPNWSQKDVSTGLQDFMICCEMALVALAHAYAFGFKTYRNPDKTAFLRDVRHNVGPLFENLGNVIYQGDIVTEAVDAFELDKSAKSVYNLGKTTTLKTTGLATDFAESTKKNITNMTENTVKTVSTFTEASVKSVSRVVDPLVKGSKDT